MPARLPSGPPKVTGRQREVARLVAEGKTNPEIAEALGISLDGAKYHVSELLGRLELSSRDEIAEWWAAEGQTGGRRRLRSFLGWPVLAGAGAAGVAVVAVALLFAALSGGDDGAAVLPNASPSLSPTSAPTEPPAEPASGGTVIDGLPGGGASGVETATLLGDGRVVFHEGAEGRLFIYDPADGSVEEQPDRLEVDSYRYQAAPLPDGRVAFVGVARQPDFDNPPDFAGRVEIFDGATGGVETAAQIPYSAEVDGQVLEGSVHLVIAGTEPVALPDGWLLFVGGSVAVLLHPTSAEVEVMAVARTAADEPSLAAHSYLPAVSPDGQVAVFSIEAGTAVQRFDVAARAFELAAEPPFVAVDATYLPNGNLFILGRAVEEPGGTVRQFTEEEELQVARAGMSMLGVEDAVHVFMVADLESGDVEVVRNGVHGLPNGLGRLAPSLVTLPSGDVAIVGGTSRVECPNAISCPQYFDETWLIDPDTGSLSSGPSLGMGAWPLDLAQLGDGSVVGVFFNDRLVGIHWRP